MEWCYYSWTFLLLLDKLLNQPTLLALDEPFGRAGDGLFSASLSHFISSNLLHDFLNDKFMFSFKKKKFM